MNKIKNKKRLFLNIAYLFIIAMFFILDRILKKMALKQGLFVSKSLIDNILGFKLFFNRNIAFSLPVSGSLLTLSISLVCLSFLIYIIYLLKNKKAKILFIFLLSLILFGALSNLIDRLLYGAVIDYLDLKFFTVFNLADLMISGGMIIYLITYIKKIELQN